MTEAELGELALELVDTVVTLLGSPAGQRVTHRKGIVRAGTFTATPRARELTRAAHMQGVPTRVTVRFSHGFPSTEGRDSTEDDPRGMAVKFYLPGGATTDLVCQDWPVFPAGTPEKFRDLLRAQHEGVEATEAFLADHPDVAAAPGGPGGLARSESVRVVTRSGARADRLRAAGAEVVLRDVTDPASLMPAVHGARVVVPAVHGAGRVTPARIDRDGNTHLVAAAQRAGADMVLVSVIGAGR